MGESWAGEAGGFESNFSWTVEGEVNSFFLFREKRIPDPKLKFKKLFKWPVIPELRHYTFEREKSN